jgi:hypothetical protein
MSYRSIKSEDVAFDLEFEVLFEAMMKFYWKLESEKISDNEKLKYVCEITEIFNQAAGLLNFWFTSLEDWRDYIQEKRRWLKGELKK